MSKRVLASTCVALVLAVLVTACSPGAQPPAPAASHQPWQAWRRKASRCAYSRAHEVVQASNHGFTRSSGRRAALNMVPV